MRESRQKIGEYEIREKLGEGAMGAVYRAVHARLKKTVAVKVLSKAVEADPVQLARFQREMELVGSLDHPHVVRATDAGESQGVHFLVMEYVDGTDLRTLVNARGPLAVPQAIDCIRQAADGLAFAHRRQVIHRDIKPANLLMDRSGVVKVADLGLARLSNWNSEDAANELTSTGTVMGTVDFMAPEQAINTRNANERSDVYSLACTFFFLLTGRPPYTGKTMMERLLAHRERPIPSVRVIRHDVPAAIDAVIEKMMAKRPEDRYRSMEQVRSALKSIDATENDSLAGTATLSFVENTAPPSGLPSALPTTLTRSNPATRRRNSRRRFWSGVTGLGLGAAALVALLLILALSNKDQTPDDSESQEHAHKSSAKKHAEKKRPEKKRAGELAWVNGRADVLASIDPLRDNSPQRGKGQARFDGNTLVIPRNSQLIVRYPFPDEYRLEMQVERRPPVDEALMLILARPDSLFGVVVGSRDRKSYVSGLQSSGSNRLHPESVMRSDAPLIQNGRHHRVVVEVRKTSVKVLVDNSLVLDWTGGFAPFRSEQSVVKSLAFTSNLAEFQIHRAEVVDLSVR